jgi:murein DD-endopeptidase MepM/ murein hydrolase activator NlpD
MRQSERKKEKDKIAIVLMLCFCVIALTSIFTIRSNINKINGSVPDVSVSEKIPAVPPQKESVDNASIDESSGVSARIPAVDSRDNHSKDQKNDSSTDSGIADSKFSRPVNTANPFVTNIYAMDSLIYSVTLDQYMTHCGIDIEAPADTQVLSIAEGTVTGIYTDDRYGNSVEIRHNSQFTAIYSNLSDAHMVEVGDTVTAGQIIGGIGTSSLFESLEPAHLHLELLKDGVYVNPLDYITLN